MDQGFAPSLFKDALKWRCEQCLLHNDHKKDICEACEHPRDELKPTTQQRPTTGVSFCSTMFSNEDPKSAPPIVFGLPNDKDRNTNQNRFSHFVDSSATTTSDDVSTFTFFHPPNGGDDDPDTPEVKKPVVSPTTEGDHHHHHPTRISQKRVRSSSGGSDKLHPESTSPFSYKRQRLEGEEDDDDDDCGDEQDPPTSVSLPSSAFVANESDSNLTPLVRPSSAPSSSIRHSEFDSKRYSFGPAPCAAVANIDHHAFSTPTFGSKEVERPKSFPTSFSGAVGSIFTWGSSECDQLAVSDSRLAEDRSMRVPFQIIKFRSKNVISIACGALHSMALLDDGRVASWGCNDDFALGRDTVDSESIPGIVEGLPRDIVALSCGDCHSSALSASGSLFLWGSYRDSSGIVGFPFSTELKSMNPVKVSNIVGKIMKVSSGENHTCVLTFVEDELTTAVFLWGSGEFGQLACEPPADKFSLLQPIRLNFEFPGRVINVFCGKASTFFEILPKSGGIPKYFACGRNSYGELGIGCQTDFEWSPKLILGLEGIQLSDIQSCQYATVALSVTGYLYTWGKRDYLGVTTIQDHCRTTPFLMPNTANIRAIGCGGDTAYSVDTSGLVMVWGEGQMYQIGDGKEYLETVKCPISLPSSSFNNSSVLAVAAGSQHANALVFNGNYHNIAGQDGDCLGARLTKLLTEKPVATEPMMNDDNKNDDDNTNKRLRTPVVECGGDLATPSAPVKRYRIDVDKKISSVQDGTLTPTKGPSIFGLSDYGSEVSRSDDKPTPSSILRLGTYSSISVSPVTPKKHQVLTPTTNKLSGIVVTPSALNILDEQTSVHSVEDNSSKPTASPTIIRAETTASAVKSPADTPVPSPLPSKSAATTPGAAASVKVPTPVPSSVKVPTPVPSSVKVPTPVPSSVKVATPLGSSVKAAGTPSSIKASATTTIDSSLKAATPAPMSEEVASVNAVDHQQQQQQQQVPPTSSSDVGTTECVKVARGRSVSPRKGQRSCSPLLTRPNSRKTPITEEEEEEDQDNPIIAAVAAVGQESSLLPTDDNRSDDSVEIVEPEVRPSRNRRKPTTLLSSQDSVSGSSQAAVVELLDENSQPEESSLETNRRPQRNIKPKAKPLPVKETSRGTKAKVLPTKAPEIEKAPKAPPKAPKGTKASAAETKTAKASAAESKTAKASAAETKTAKASAAETKTAKAAAAETKTAKAAAAETKTAKAAAETKNAKAAAAETKTAKAAAAETKTAKASAAETKVTKAAGDTKAAKSSETKAAKSSETKATKSSAEKSAKNVDEEEGRPIRSKAGAKKKPETRKDAKAVEIILDSEASSGDVKPGGRRKTPSAKGRGK